MSFPHRKLHPEIPTVYTFAHDEVVWTIRNLIKQRFSRLYLLFLFAT
jgi:hypothetical protein